MVFIQITLFEMDDKNIHPVHRIKRGVKGEMSRINLFLIEKAQSLY
jgi:hypothetical protein